MRYSDLFGKTRRDAPADLTDPAIRLAFRAGLIRVLAGGEMVYLPLAALVLERIVAEMRAGLQELGAQELRVTTAPDLSLLAAQEIQSYKQIPARLFWFAEGGTRLDLASIETSQNAAAETSREFEAFAYRSFEWAQVVSAAAVGLGHSRIWYSPAASGDLEFLRCSNGDYTATRESARVHKLAAPAEDLLPLQTVATPHCDTIDSLAQFLGVPATRTAKAVFYYGNGQVVFAVVRGDLQIDEEKLKRELGLSKLRFATDDEIQQAGASPGYASPVGVRGVKIIADDSIIASPNLVAGANREGFHLLNTNVPRDYRPDVVTDIALARPGAPCPNGDGKLELAHGLSLANAPMPRPLESSYLDSGGRAAKAFAARMEIDLPHIILAHIATHNDAKGILWGSQLAPFQTHIVALNPDKPGVEEAVERVTKELERSGIDHLVDDRPESAGVKFNDADLIGLPMRLTIGPRTVAIDAVEMKKREETAARLIPLDELASALEF
jgi:prolyl-tRNA synthetase